MVGFGLCWWTDVDCGVDSACGQGRTVVVTCGQAIATQRLRIPVALPLQGQLQAQS